MLFYLLDWRLHYIEASSILLMTIHVKDLVVITKAGYIHPVHSAQWRSPNSKAVHHNHCIHPDFIENEITESLRRLQTDKIDIFMLNNPERMLLDPNKVRHWKGKRNVYASCCRNILIDATFHNIDILYEQTI